MKKKNLNLIITLFLSIISFYSNAQGQLKVSGGQTLIPLNSSYWIRDYSSTPQDNGVRLRMHAHSGYQSAYIDYWKNLFFRSGDPGTRLNMALTDDGFVGINMMPYSWATSNSNSSSKWCNTQSNMRLQVYGNIISHGYYHWSDSSLKSNVELVENCTDKLLALTPRKYNYKTEINIEGNVPQGDSTVDSAYIHLHTLVSISEPKHYGLYAQDVKRQFPNLVSTMGNYEAVNYGELTTILIKGFQEQQKTIDTLKIINDSLNLQIQNLRQEIVNWKGSTIDTPSDKTRLFQNNPNPFDGITTFSYYIDENSVVTNAIIEIRNIMGNLITTLSLGDQSGIGQVQFNGGSLNQGYYIYTLKINGNIKDSKMFLKEQ